MTRRPWTVPAAGGYDARMKAGPLLALLLLAAAAAGAEELCPRVRFEGPSVKLTEVEKRLVCGDPGSDGWKNVSLPQARTFMTAFLQARGRHFPRFTAEDDALVVEIGTATVVSKVTGSGLDGIYDLGKRRGITGELLTPALLNKTKKGVQFELQSRGYACPEAAVTADARTGEVHVDARPGIRNTMEGIVPASVKGVDPEVFRRYEAFRPETGFDTRLLSLTADRVKQDQLFLSAYYDVVCSTGGLNIVQRVVEGPPILFTVGVGADTEGLLLGKLRLQDSRLGARASSAEADLFASKLEQSLDVFYKSWLGNGERLYLRPEAFLRHESEIQYDAAHAEAGLSPGWSRDGEDLHLDVRGGPAYEYFDTERGIGPRGSRWLSFNTRSQVMSHLYEYFQRDPRRGWTAALETSSRVRAVESRVTANRVQATGEALWNLGRFEPPLAVLATRGLAGATAIGGDRTAGLAAVPPTDRFFLGGDGDIRGFPRKRLPDDAAGFLTAAYEGTELRAGDVLPYGLQPFIFLDAAMAGRRAFDLDPDVYYAPGVGLRWASPFGAIRATVARGLVWVRDPRQPAPRPGIEIFFSFGKEF